MPAISLAEVAANRRSIEVDLGLPPTEDGTPQTLTVTYRVNAVTPADELLFAGVKSAEDVPETQMAALLGFFCRLVSSWELTDTTGGAVVPVETEALRRVPIAIIKNVLRDCLADLNDPKASMSTAAS